MHELKIIQSLFETRLNRFSVKGAIEIFHPDRKTIF
jgi:hypothetical protein